METRAKWEYLAAIHGRYRAATREEKGRILDEFCETTGYHRKYVLRRLNGPPPGATPPARRRRPPRYGLAVIQALTRIWEAAGYPWSVRPKALLPLWLRWAQRRLRLSATVCQQLRQISPRQIDRRPAAAKRSCRTRRDGHTKPGTLLKHHIALKTDHWDVTVPGFTELDLVAHCGSRADGEFAHSLNVTDIDTTWVETSGVPGATGPRRSGGTRSSGWSAGPPSCRRRGGRGWPITACSPHASDGARPSSRRRRRPPRAYPRVGQR